MAQKPNDAALRAIIDRFTRELTQAVAQQVQEQVAQAISQFRGPSPKSDGRRAGRLCPVPNCGQPGAGPRNRWFCKNHAAKLSATEQKSILERNRRLAADGKLPTQVPAQRIVRLPPKAQRARRALDMSCRVEGCPNRSRGPRAGFICDQHRNELSPDEQRAARDRWNARMKGGKSVASAPEPKTISPVPPIVRKAEPAEA
jgi:hypothetical protein